MQQEPLTTEQRLARLEHAVTDLQRRANAQEARDIALLAGIDGFIEDLRRVERVQLKGFDGLELQLQEVGADVKSQGVEFKSQGASLDLAVKNIGVLAEAQRSHQENVAAPGSTPTLPAVHRIHPSLPISGPAFPSPRLRDTQPKHAFSSSQGRKQASVPGRHKQPEQGVGEQDTPDWLWRDMNTCAWSVPWPDWLALNRCEKTLQVWLILGLKAKERPALPGPGLCVLAQIPIPAANARGL